VTVHVVPTRRAKGAARERLVIEAAAEVIAERGLANVRMTDIAERAGMSAGHVTYYFPSKTGLLMRTLEHSEADLHQEVVAEVRRIHDPWQRLYRLIESAASKGKGDPGWVLWFEVWANAGLDEELAKFQAELDSRWRSTLAEVIRYGCDSGAFVTDDPGAVSTLLSCLIDGLSVHVTLGDEHMTNEAMKKLYFRAAESLLNPTPPTRQQAHDK
jgi:AcrR family transcriptional regulator